MDKLSKKARLEQYKCREVIGGVCAIRCEGNGRTWLKSTSDMAGEKNRFQFSLSNGSCLNPTMMKEWQQYGPQSFSFMVLEELKKKDMQTDEEFAQDVRDLLALWKEKEEQDR